MGEPAFDVELAVRAIASADRRRALEVLAGGEAASGSIAEACGWSAPAASQQLRVLREAGLVDVRADGNRRLYRARRESLWELQTFLDAFWRERLGLLAAAVEREDAT